MKKTVFTLILGLIFHFDCFGTSQYKGYVETEELLKSRIGQSGQKFILGSFIGETFSTFEPSLLDLLGTYKSGFGGISKGFRNGKPNSMNMLVWNLIMQGLSEDISLICTAKASLKYAADFHDTVKVLCRWPLPESQSDEILIDYWTWLMGYEAPHDETVLWMKYAREKMQQLTGPQAISQMSYMILMNPYFLLKH